MKFGQLLEYKKRNIFPKKNAKHELWRLVQDPFLFFKKVSYKEVKASGLQNGFNVFC